MTLYTHTGLINLLIGRKEDRGRRAEESRQRTVTAGWLKTTICHCGMEREKRGKRDEWGEEKPLRMKD